MDEINALKSTIREYEELLSSPADQHKSYPSTEELVNKLSMSHDWTHQGALALVDLANKYGSFMLRNALTPAVVIDKEDGTLGF